MNKPTRCVVTGSTGKHPAPFHIKSDVTPNAPGKQPDPAPFVYIHGVTGKQPDHTPCIKYHVTESNQATQQPNQAAASSTVQTREFVLKGVMQTPSCTLGRVPRFWCPLPRRAETTAVRK